MDTDTETFLQKRREQNERTKKRIILISVIACLLWVPAALFIYKPPALFTETVEDTAAVKQDT